MMKADEQLIAELLEDCDDELRDLAGKFSAVADAPSSAREAFLHDLDELLDFRLMIMEATR